MDDLQQRLRLIKCLCILILAAAFIIVQGPTAASEHAPSPQAAQSPNGSENQKPSERFDMLVRDDFFAGMTGDEARLDHGMKLCEAVLSRNPKHAEALVWHGGGLLTRSSRAYASGDSATGNKLWQQGLDEMNKAREYEPGNMGVKIGRAATLIGMAQAGWDTSDNQARALLESAVADYETVYQWQRPSFDKLPVHNRGELLFGLATGWSILGDSQKARLYLELVIAKCKDSTYDKEARTLLSESPLPRVDHNCTGCHIGASH